MKREEEEGCYKAFDSDKLVVHIGPAALSKADEDCCQGLEEGVEVVAERSAIHKIDCIIRKLDLVCKQLHSDYRVYEHD